MFCCHCGARNPDTATYCHKWGGILFKEPGVEVQESLSPVNAPATPPRVSEEQRRYVDELLPIDQKPHECHACGSGDNIYSWDFGLGKKTGTKRNWLITAA